MTLGTGAVSIRRIQVLENPTRTNFSWITERLSQKLVTPIGIDEVREESIGWCHPFSGEPSLSDARDLCYDNAFVFGLRADSKKVPGTLFRLQMKAALEALSRGPSGEDGKAKRIPKKLKDAARDRIRQELLKHTLPAIRLFEIVWHMDSNEIWIASTSKSGFDVFEKLFQETFALPVALINPGTMCVEFGRAMYEPDYSLEKLCELVPVDILAYRKAAAAAQKTTDAAPF
jgi:hypothetical protein